MKQYDAIVIGGGILGCFTARNLRRWQISTLMVEAQDDVCKGITRANSAIIYPGYDNRPGTKKAEMTVRGNLEYGKLCQELEVPFSRCGSLLVTYDASCVSQLEKKLHHGIQNGVPGLRLLSGSEVEAMEPMLRPGVVAAMYAPGTGTVNPWKLGIAACENAVQNGAHAMCSTTVLAIEKSASGYCIETDRGSFSCRVVLNCAGLYADKVQQLLFPPTVQLRWDTAEYLVLDSMAAKPARILFQQAHRCGKGITAIPCVEGNLLISGIRKPLRTPFATTPEGLQELYACARNLLPDVDLGAVIRSFGAVRPNPYTQNEDSLHDFCIENPGPGFYSLIGIKTPGLTCANELGMHLARQAAACLNAGKNPHFDPHRRSITQKDHHIVCQCEQITKAEVLEAIRRGATTVDGVKRRVGSGMGRCQGSRCSFEIEKLLEDYGHGTL